MVFHISINGRNVDEAFRNLLAPPSDAAEDTPPPVEDDFDCLRIASIVCKVAFLILLFPISLMVIPFVTTEESFFNWLTGRNILPVNSLSQPHQGELPEHFLERRRNPLREPPVELRPLPNPPGGARFSIRNMYVLNPVLFAFLFQQQQAPVSTPVYVPTEEDKAAVHQSIMGKEPPKALPSLELTEIGVLKNAPQGFLAYTSIEKVSLGENPKIEEKINIRMIGIKAERRAEIIATMREEARRQIRGREAFKEFWARNSAFVAMNPSKCVLFEEIFKNFQDDAFTTPQNWQALALERLEACDDFTSITSDILLDDILEIVRREMYNRFPDDQKAFQYLILLLNIFDLYRTFMSEEGKLEEYYERFEGTMNAVKEALSAGCGYNRMAGLRTLLIETLCLHKALLAQIGLESDKDALFALTMDEVRTNLIRHQIMEKATERVKIFTERLLSNMTEPQIRSLANVWMVHLGPDPINGLLGKNGNELTSQEIKKLVEGPPSGQPDVQESVELECTIRQRLNWTTDRHNPHFFHAADQNPIRRGAVSAVEGAVRSLYKPMELLLQDLTSAYPTNKKLHADIGNWYLEQGLDFKENLDLLANEELLAEVMADGTFDEDREYNNAHYSEAAVYYYMIKNGFFQLQEPSAAKHDHIIHGLGQRESWISC